MSRRTGLRWTLRNRFPRVSGDEPKRQAEPAETGTLSLRERG